MLRIVLITAVCAAMLSAGCDMLAGADGSSAGQGTPIVAPGPANTDLPAYQSELLELAFDTASAIPLQPHIKDRSKMQELVVATALALDQPARAREFADDIADWRRGEAYANYAFHCAEQGMAGEAEAYLERAASVAAEAEDWRRDTIRVRIAQTYLQLKQPVKAAEFDKGLTESETGKSHAVRARLIDDELFSAQVEALDALLATDLFDPSRNALNAYAALFDRFYDDVERRTLAERRIKDSWSMFPHLIRIELLRELVDAALAHEDKAKALELVRETQALIDNLNWKAEYHVPLLAHHASRQFRAGDIEGGRATAARALAIFEAERETIVNIYRAGGLRPLAESYLAMGDMKAAQRVYALTIDEGAINPNARPRAEDLCATLCSMAQHQFEPGPELWNRIREVRMGLNHPW